MIALIIQKCMRLISQPKGEDYFTNDISNPLISLKNCFNQQPFTTGNSGKMQQIKNNHSSKPVLPVKWNLGLERYIK